MARSWVPFVMIRFFRNLRVHVNEITRALVFIECHLQVAVKLFGRNVKC